MSMWYEKLKPVLRDPSYLKRKLADEHGHVDLSDLRSGIAWQLAPDINQDPEFGEQEVREKTLAYLHTLLAEGKVKVGKVKRLKPGQSVITDPERAHEVSIFEDIEGTPDEIIEYIRTEWNTNPDFIEQYDCVIRLPENPWSM